MVVTGATSLGAAATQACPFISYPQSRVWVLVFLGLDRGVGLGFCLDRGVVFLLVLALALSFVLVLVLALGLGL